MLTLFWSQKLNMAEYGEWNRKWVILSAIIHGIECKQYGVYRDFIVKGIRAVQT